ncbi:MAG: class I SAM-dependent methyltransferase [Verrucomicrobiales bacterium]|nr:class I SAM-dependent methyltransferase [Verrucomicrobiales bacterium]
MKEMIKEVCGNVAGCLLPGAKRALASGGKEPRGAMEKLISYSLIKKAARRGDEVDLRKHLTQYWKGDAGDSFYETFGDRFETSFLGEHYSLVEALDAEIRDSEGKYHQLIEIGCGDGRVINHLSEKFSDLDEFIGLDINAGIVKKNRQVYDVETLSFESGDASVLIKQKAKRGTVLLSYGGVMEYFLEAELVEMFRYLKEQSPSLVALVEPLYDGFDPDTEMKSRSSGQEYSFSHNHRHLLESCGFEIKYRQLLESDFRWMMIVAEG